MVCGELQPNYPNGAEPICSGQKSICTFASTNSDDGLQASVGDVDIGVQACCDADLDCNFYTTCYTYKHSASCDDALCLFWYVWMSL